MRTRTYACAVPAGSAINARLPGAYFHDCHALIVPDAKQPALAYFLAALANTPSWVSTLMAWRNRLAQLVGLKNLGGFDGFDPAKPASSYQPGERVGIFTVIINTETEALLGDSDKHLDVVLSVFKQPDAAEGRVSIAVTTVVHVHNLLGRLYMLPVAPLHKIIAPAVTQRMMTGCAISAADRHP